MSLGNRCGFYSRRDVYRTSDLSCKGSIDVSKRAIIKSPHKPAADN